MSALLSPTRASKAYWVKFRLVQQPDTCINIAPTDNRFFLTARDPVSGAIYGSRSWDVRTAGGCP